MIKILKTTVGDIVDVQSGIHAKAGNQGNLVYIQPSQFDEFGQLKKRLYPNISASDIEERHILREGDVLYAAKGANNFAAEFESHNPQSVASTSFFVLRKKQNIVSSAFLVWYLNSIEVQRLIKLKAKGTDILSIRKNDIQELEIKIPDEKTQEIILKVAELQQKEKQLFQQIIEKRQLLINSNILNLLAK